MKVQIKISNIETPFTLKNGEALISFLGAVIFAAFNASSSELSEPLTATLNGKKYTFKNKVVNVLTESLPKFERLAFTENGEILKANFVGFVFNTLFSGVKDFKGLILHKNKGINTAATNMCNLSEVISVLLAEYKERKVFQRLSIQNGIRSAQKHGIGCNIEKYTRELKEVNAEIKAFKLPAVSAAKQLNAATRKNRNKKPAVKVGTPAEILTA